MWKRLLALCLLVVTLLTLSGCGSESQPESGEPEETNESAYDTFLLKKGVLLSKEFISFDTIKLENSYDGTEPVDVQIATLTNAETNESYKCLRLSLSVYSTISGKFTDAAIVLDANEVDSAIAAFSYMAEQLESGSLKDYTELVYETTGGAKFILCYSGKSDTTLQVEIGNGIALFDTSALSALVEGLTKAKEELLK